MIHAPLHPFPARMAPELVLAPLAGLRGESHVIDPMCGSGTVLRACVERGISCTGIDVDPLAVLISRVWTRPVDVAGLSDSAATVVARARELSLDAVWHPSGEEESDFIKFWFGPRQASELARLATVLRSEEHETYRDLLSVAMSRIIVTKDRGASLARDVSHSRPHKVTDVNDFEVYPAFVRSASQLASRLDAERIQATAEVRLGDARFLQGVEDGRFDAAITSPPYLNALDYLRGHRMTLVWLGYDLGQLRTIRAAAIGAERMSESAPCDVTQYVSRTGVSEGRPRHLGWYRRYAADLLAVLTELRRVVTRGGTVTVVMADSVLGGLLFRNADLLCDLAVTAGLEQLERRTRKLPADKRYLPPPETGARRLASRMREETIATFCVT